MISVVILLENIGAGDHPVLKAFLNTYLTLCDNALSGKGHDIKEPV